MIGSARLQRLKQSTVWITGEGEMFSPFPSRGKARKRQSMQLAYIRSLMRGANLADRVDRLMFADRLEDAGMLLEARVVRECSIKLQAQPEDIPVRGNVLFSGDADIDRQAENEVIEQLEDGNEWAWCCACVCAFWWADDFEYEGWDCLGRCSYESEEDFKQYGGDYEDMVAAAIVKLLQNVQKAN